MGGFLLVLALIGALLYAFARIFRRRVQKNLQRAGVELPPELLAAQVARAAGKAPARALPAIPVSGPVPGPAHVPAGAPALHFMLIYDVDPDFVARRAPYRDEHLALAWKAADAGALLLAGALEEPAAQAFLLFRGSREAASRFAQADPYVRHGLVRKWQVRQWHTVAGTTAAMPLRPRS